MTDSSIGCLAYGEENQPLWVRSYAVNAASLPDWLSPSKGKTERKRVCAKKSVHGIDA